MGLAHDYRRAVAENRRIMARRNREQRLENEAQAEAAGVSLGSFPAAGKVLRIGSPENKMLTRPEAFEDKGVPEYDEPPTAPEPKGLADVPFASDRARELAEEAGLTDAAFSGQPYSGAGGFTSADVRAIIEGGGEG